MGAGGSWNPEDIAKDTVGSLKKKTKDVGYSIDKFKNKIGSNVEQAITDTGDLLQENVYDPVRDFANRLLPEEDGSSETSSGSGDSAVDSAPSYSLDVEAARKRNRALALRRGFASTQRAAGNTDSASTLSPTLSGKTKLGQ